MSVHKCLGVELNKEKWNWSYKNKLKCELGDKVLPDVIPFINNLNKMWGKNVHKLKMCVVGCCEKGNKCVVVSFEN